MAQFTTASDFKEKFNTNSDDIETFIKLFNEKASKGELVMNTGLDDCPYLNNEEFTIAKIAAIKAGWNIEQFEDNYNTTSYKFSQIK